MNFSTRKPLYKGTLLSVITLFQHFNIYLRQFMYHFRSNDNFVALNCIYTAPAFFAIPPNLIKSIEKPHIAINAI